jgi:hypothetical protein
MKIKKAEKTELPSEGEKLTLKSIWEILQETEKKIQETSRLLRQNQELIKDLAKKSSEIFLHDP